MLRKIGDDDFLDAIENYQREFKEMDSANIDYDKFFFDVSHAYDDMFVR